MKIFALASGIVCRKRFGVVAAGVSAADYVHWLKKSAKSIELLGM